MNHFVVDALFIAFGVLTVAICAKRGFFLTMLKFCKLLLSVVAAYFLGGAFGRFLGEKFLNTPIRNSVFNKINAIYLNATEGFNAESALEAVPDFLLNDSLREQINSLEGSGEALVNSITDTVAGALSSVVCAILGFLVVFVAAFLLLTIVYVLVKGFRSKLKLLALADGIIGGVLGFILAWVILLIAGSVLKFFFSGNDLYAQSVIAKFFGESSLLDSIRLLNINEWLNKIQSAK